MTQNRTAASINDLLEALNDGIGFYDHAASEVNDVTHRQLFQDMGRIKRAIVGELKREVLRQGGEPTNDSTWLGEFRQGYADLRARLVKDSDAAYVASLEAQEDRVLHAFRAAGDADQPDRVREISAKYLPEVQGMHDRMRTLKLARKD